MTMRWGLIRQQEGTAGTHVGISVAQLCLIMGCKVITDYHRKALKRQLEQRVAVVPTSRGCVESPVASRHVDISVCVGAKPGVARPDAALVAVRSDVQYRLLCQCLRIVCHDPAVVWVPITRRSPSEIQKVIHQQ